MARTKQTARRSNHGTPKPSDSPARQDVKPPSQPKELDEKDRAKLLQHLNRSAVPFSVTTVPLNRKRKREPPLQTQTDIFEDRLAVQYEIKPANNWEVLRRYKRFTVGEESIAVGQCIFVKHDDGSEEGKLNLGEQWKAKVLEVRALDPEHVYIRVSWLNRPEDLDTGRKAYHGKNELIPTNQMDIIDAMAVNGRLDLYHWNEADDDSQMPGKDEFFWRQTYDFANTKTFSELRLLCIDSAPQNPDEMILQCPNEDCRKWLHVRCIAKNAVQRAKGDGSAKHKSSTPTPNKKRGRPKSVHTSANSSALAEAQQDAFTAEVYITGTPNGPDGTPASTTEIVITNEEGERHAEDVCCLFCNTKID